MNWDAVAHWGGTFVATLAAHWVSPHANRAIAALKVQVEQLAARVGLLEKRLPAKLELAERPNEP